MKTDRKSFPLKVLFSAIVLGFSILLGASALPAHQEQTESDDGRWIFLKGEGVIDAPLPIVAHYFRDLNKSKSMIPGLKIKKIFQQISASERIDYDHYELPWPFKDRYTIYRARTNYIAGREIRITLDSVENYPFEDTGKVVLRIKESRFLLKSLPEDATKTRVTIQLKLDPGGYLPLWLIDLNARTWSQDLLKNLRKSIRKEKARKNISRTNTTAKPRPSFSY